MRRSHHWSGWSPTWPLPLLRSIARWPVDGRADPDPEVIIAPTRAVSSVYPRLHLRPVCDLRVCLSAFRERRVRVCCARVVTCLSTHAQTRDRSRSRRSEKSRCALEHTALGFPLLLPVRRGAGGARRTGRTRAGAAAAGARPRADPEGEARGCGLARRPERGAGRRGGRRLGA